MYYIFRNMAGRRKRHTPPPSRPKRHRTRPARLRSPSPAPNGRPRSPSPPSQTRSSRDARQRSSRDPRPRSPGPSPPTHSGDHSLSPPPTRRTRSRSPLQTHQQPHGSSLDPHYSPQPIITTADSTLAAVANSLSSMQDLLVQQQQNFLSAVNNMQHSLAAFSSHRQTNPPTHTATSQHGVGVCHTTGPASAEVTDHGVGVCHTTSPHQGVGVRHTTSTDPQGEPTIPLAIYYQPTTRPLRSTAAPIGHNVPQALKIKIWQHKYIELADLIHNNRTTDYTLALTTEEGLPQFRLASKKKKQLSQQEWTQAMFIFIAVYIERYPEETTALLSYAQNVRDLMDNGANWAWYDIQFRTDREFSRCKWDEMRQDLELRSFRKTTDKPFRSSYANQTRNSTSKDDRPPQGYCYAFHARNQRCTNQHCTFKHTCPRCRGPHPLFMRCNSHKPSATTTSAREDSPRRDQNRRRHTSESRKTGKST